MNLDWILSPISMYGAVGAVGIASLYQAFSTRADLAKRSASEAGERQKILQMVEVLSAKHAQVSLEAAERSAPLEPRAQPSALNMNKRAEALRMYRRGSDPHTIAAALALPLADVMLLKKVYIVLTEAVAAP